jgi:hypothetical protein
MVNIDDREAMLICKLLHNEVTVDKVKSEAFKKAQTDDEAEALLDEMIADVERQLFELLEFGL